MEKKFNFLFFSTDDFAIPTLDELCKIGSCLGAVTKPPRPKGRGLKLTANPIDEYATTNGLVSIHTTNVKNPELISSLKKLDPDFIISLSNPFILPSQILSIPKWAVNIHPSLLPKYRGAAPINWVLINGEDKTGITTILMNERIDAGAIIDQIEVDIKPLETYGELRSRLVNLTPEITMKTVKSLLSNSASPQIQNKEKISYAPKISKDLTKIEWNKSGNDLVNLIRGLSPFPGARTLFRTQVVKILFAAPFNVNSLMPGKIKKVDKKLIVGTGSEAIEIRLLCVAGSKEISGQEFINGYHPEDEKFG